MKDLLQQATLLQNLQVEVKVTIVLERQNYVELHFHVYNDFHANVHAFNANQWYIMSKKINSMCLVINNKPLSRLHNLER